MTPDEYKKQFFQEFTPDPLEQLSDRQLLAMKCNRYWDADERKRASKILIRREEERELNFAKRK